MTDSGSTQLPPSSRIPLPSTQGRPSEARPVAIENLPEALRESSENIRVRGEVIEANRDGSVRVRTDYGDFDVRHPPKDKPPREGQRVEVEIQRGNPPREATVRTVQAEPQTQQTQQNAPQTADGPRSTSTPVNLELSPANPNGSAIQNASNAQATTIQTASQNATPVRLQALSAQEAASLIVGNNPQTLSASLTQQIVFQVDLIALEAQLSTGTIRSPSVTAAHTTQAQTQSLVLSDFSPQLQTSEVSQISADITVPSSQSSINVFSLSGPSVIDTQITTTLPTASQVSLGPATLPATTILTGAITPNTPNAQSFTPLSPPAGETSINVSIQSVQPPAVQIVANSAKVAADGSSTPPAGKIAENAAPIPITEAVKAGSINATVSGFTTQNLPILSFTTPQNTATQNFALHIPAPDIPVGSQVQITPHSALAQAVPAASLITPSITGFITPGEWPLMQDLQQAVAQLSTASAQVISNISPSPANPAQFTPAALFFLSAVRSGDIGGWLGDKTVEMLRRAGKGNLLSRLSAEGGMLSRLSAEPVSQDWRALPLPMAWENEMQKVTLFYKREEREGSDNQDGEKQTRFVFDLNLSKMGPVQVDGLYRNKRLDIILRTEQRFTEAMHMAMRKTYADALRQTDVTGELSFQNTPDQWVKINVEDEGKSVVA